MQDLFYELKQVLVQHSPKYNTLCDIEQYILDLQHQLEEKDKIIAEAYDWANEKSIYYLEKEKQGNYFKNCNCDKLLEILERR